MTQLIGYLLLCALNKGENWMIYLIFSEIPIYFIRKKRSDRITSMQI